MTKHFTIILGVLTSPGPKYFAFPAPPPSPALPKTPQTCYQLPILLAYCNLSACQFTQVAISLLRSELLKLGICRFVTICYNFVATSLFMTSCNNQIATSLLTTCNRLVVTSCRKPCKGILILACRNILVVARCHQTC